MFFIPKPGSEKRMAFRARANKLLIANSAHTPTPEIMFRAMIEDGSAKLVRRPNKPPLLRMATASEIKAHKQARAA